MSKNSKADRKKDEEKDLEEEEHDEGSDDEEDEEGEEEADERPAASAKAGAARPRARAKVHDDHDDHGHDDEDSEEDDPSWWAPHAVMAALVLIGVLGFFGVFNKVLAGIAVHPAGAVGGDTSGETNKPKPAEPAKAPTPAPRPGLPEGATGETYGARHLLVMYKGSMRAPGTITRSEDEAKARATEAQKKAKAGAKFEDLVKEYSDEPGAGQRGGDLGTFRKGQMVPEFQTAVEKMKVGEVSDLVKTPFGYHVILRTK